MLQFLQVLLVSGLDEDLLQCCQTFWDFLIITVSLLKVQRGLVGSLSLVLSNNVIAEVLRRCSHLVECVSCQECLELPMVAVCIQMIMQRQKLLFKNRRFCEKWCLYVHWGGKKRKEQTLHVPYP